MMACMNPSGGRPRSAAVDVAVSRAVHELLAIGGYQTLSIERVAAAAKVGKATIYRRWRSKAEMVFALVIHDEAITPLPDYGTLERDLRALVEHVIALVSAPGARDCLPGLLADLRSDPPLAKRFHDSYIAAERRVVEGLLGRAVARGELAVPGDSAGVHAQLLGTVFAWIFLVAEAPPDDLADRISRSLLANLTR